MNCRTGFWDMPDIKHVCDQDDGISFLASIWCCSCDIWSVKGCLDKPIYILLHDVTVTSNLLGTLGGFPGGSVGKESACHAGDPGLIPGLGRFLGEGNGNSLQYLTWKIPWTEELGGHGFSPWVHEFAKSRIRLTNTRENT